MNRCLTWLSNQSPLAVASFGRRLECTPTVVVFFFKSLVRKLRPRESQALHVGFSVVVVAELSDRTVRHSPSKDPPLPEKSPNVPGDTTFFSESGISIRK